MQCIINPPFAREASFTVDQVGKDVSYTWDAAVCLFAIIRLTICIARLVHHLSRWTSEKAHRISWISGTKANILFALKMNLNLNPSLVLASVFLTSFFLLSILYHVSEGGLRDQGAYNRFWNFENAAWVAAQQVLMAGVSGPEVPQTHLSQFISLFGCFVGLFICCLFILVVYNLTMFSPYEEEIFKRARQRKHFQSDSMLISEA